MATHRAEVAKRMAAAIATFRHAVEWRTREFGPNSLNVAAALHDLGDLLLEDSQLDEAVDHLQRAFTIRAASASLPDNNEDEAAKDVRKDTAVSRYTLGRLYEQRGDYEAARKVRREGRDLAQVVCGDEECGYDGTLDRNTSQGCTNCQAVFYCCKKCWRADWRARHKEHCKRYGALDQTENAEASTSAAGPPHPTQPTAASGSAATKRRNKRRENKRKAKNAGGSGVSGPEQTQAEPQDDAGHDEDAVGVEEHGGSQSPSNTTLHLRLSGGTPLNAD